MIGPRQPVKRLFLPSQRMRMSSFHEIASMKTKSQLEVWGAPMRTVGRSGAGSDTIRHELKVQKVRAMRRRRNMGTSLGDRLAE